MPEHTRPTLRAGRTESAGTNTETEPTLKFAAGQSWRLEGIRILEIPAPYYGDRLRRQFPPSSRVLTLALRSPLPLCILAILVIHIPTIYFLLHNVEIS